MGGNLDLAQSMFDASPATCWCVVARPQVDKIRQEKLSLAKEKSDLHSHVRMGPGRSPPFKLLGGLGMPLFSETV